jgi:hypothetical protein
LTSRASRMNLVVVFVVFAGLGLVKAWVCCWHPYFDDRQIGM